LSDQPDVSPPAAVTAPGAGYRVLARKYRPTNFAELIGQDALVRTLTNAIQSGRIAQAFMLTGVRGVGKTTTARIIARALNCIGPDGRGGPTISPCGVCDPCQAIAQDRHVDVLELDAASNTSVNDMREIIGGVRYAPVSARYKLYIIDEVHMLSNSAFNALLKTLEEPPSHVKFVFATTEIRKVPVTVLSRCQRFDLRRVATPVLIEHFGRIAGKEGVTVEPEALALVARAADGSVRDGLSLLDQAIALGSGATVTALQVRDMLGLADRAQVLDLFEATVSARPAEALELAGELHRSGADPLMVLRDLLDYSHFLTRLKVLPALAENPALPEAERRRGAELARALAMPSLTRVWQLLLKGLGEVQLAPVPQQALEMVLIRLAYAAALPPPAELIRQLEGSAGGAGGGPGNGPSGAPAGGAPGGGNAFGGGPAGRVTMAGAPAAAPRAFATVVPTAGTASQAAQAAAPCPPPESTAPAASPADFRALVQLFAERREGTLYGHFHSNVHLVRLEPGLLELRPGPGAPQSLANRASVLLSEWTGRRWIVAISDQPGQKTLAEQDAEAANRALADARSHPLVRLVLETFPGAEITEVRDLAAGTGPESAAESDDAGAEAGGSAEWDESAFESIDDQGGF